jgi:hypothetical protein
MSNIINIQAIAPKTVLTSTFAQAVYPNTNGVTFVAPIGFKLVEIDPAKFNKTSPDFEAATYVNLQTGEVVIAYRGSTNIGVATTAANAASTGTWNPQFTDATNHKATGSSLVLKH